MIVIKPEDLDQEPKASGQPIVVRPEQLDTEPSTAMQRLMGVKVPDQPQTPGPDALDTFHQALSGASQFTDPQGNGYSPILKAMKDPGAVATDIGARLSGQTGFGSKAPNDPSYLFTPPINFIHGAISANTPIKTGSGDLDALKTAWASGLKGMTNPSADNLPGAQFQKAYPNLNWILSGTAGAALDILPMLIGGKEALTADEQVAKMQKYGTDTQLARINENSNGVDFKKEIQDTIAEIQKRNPDMTPDQLTRAQGQLSNFVGKAGSSFNGATGLDFVERIFKPGGLKDFIFSTDKGSEIPTVLKGIFKKEAPNLDITKTFEDLPQPKVVSPDEVEPYQPASREAEFTPPSVEDIGLKPGEVKKTPGALTPEQQIENIQNSRGTPEAKEAAIEAIKTGTPNKLIEAKPEPASVDTEGEPNAKQPTREAVPEFKSTNEAIAHGKAIQGDSEAIGTLQRGLALLQPEIDKAREANDFQKGMDLATKKQFINEALKHATKTPEIIDAEKAGKVLGIDSETKLPIIDQTQPATNSHIEPAKLDAEKQKTLTNATDYAVQVTKTQGRLLSFDDLWTGYKSTHRSGLTKEGFQIVYDSVKELTDKKQVSDKAPIQNQPTSRPKVSVEVSDKAPVSKAGGIEVSFGPEDKVQKTLIKGAGPQVHTITKELPREKGDLPDEKFYQVKNDTTGKVSTVEAKDLKPIKGKAEPAEPKAQKQRGPIKNPKTLAGRVKQLGGVDPKSLRDAGYTIQDFTENGLMNLLKSKEKGGIALSVMADNLASRGEIHGYQEGDTAVDKLMDALKGKQAYGEKAVEYDKLAKQEYENYVAKYGEPTADEIASAEKSAKAEAQGEVVSEAIRGDAFEEPKEQLEPGATDFPSEEKSTLPKQSESKEILGQAKLPEGGLKAKAPQSESPLTEFNQANSEEKQPDLFEDDKKTGEEGFIDVGVIKDAATKVIKDGLDYVHNTRDIVRFTGNLERDFNRVLTNAVADEIRAKKLIKEANISPMDAEAIYHYAENKNEPITPEQKALFDKYIAPLQDARNKLFSIVVGAGVPLSSEDYTPRFVMNRGGVFDRLKAGAKSVGGGNALRQTTENMKSRVMRSATNAAGKRIVVAVKGQDVLWGKQPFGSLEQPKGPKFKEFYDKILMESLNKLAKDLGIKHTRATGGPGLGGNRAGVSFQGGRLVKTRYATPERVLLHEIGHQLDHMYGLQDMFIKNSTPAEKKEIRNLVDLKWQDQETTDYFKKYVRIGTEKIAALFESYLHVPEQFQKIAPLTYKKFTDFLASRPELKPILDLKPSMVLGMTKVAPERLEKNVFLDNEGKKWTLGDATTKEIEAATDLRYHKNILLNELTAYNKLNKVARAIDFLNAFKNSPDFEKVAMKSGTANVPKGWGATKLPQFLGYMFEPHVADALDKFAGDIQSKNAGNILTAVNQFLRNAIFFNPLMHIPNIGAHWTVNRGLVGSAKTVLPHEFARLMRTTSKAALAIATQNQDYLDMLESGANLLYSGQTESLAKMMLKAMGENKTSLQKMADQLGIVNPVNWLKTIYGLSGKATWFTNDLATMQTVYDHMENGMSMEDAILETSKHIPDYRVPSRIFNSAWISKLMRDPNLTMFGAYHYGMLKSYGEMAKTIASDAPPKEKAETLDKLMMLGVMMIFLYPFLDKIVQKLKGDPNAHVRRAGATTFVDQLWKLHTGEKSASDVAQSIVIPAVGTKTLAEVFLNRDFRTGKKVYNPGNEVEDLKNKAIQSISPTKSAQDVISGRKSPSDFAWSLAGVSSHEERTPAKIKATQMMADNLPQGSKTEEQQADALERSKIGADYRKTKDMSILKNAVDEGKLTHTEAHFIYKHADDTFLQRVTRSLSWKDIPKIMEKATPEEMIELKDIFKIKAKNAFEKAKKDPEEQAAIMKQVVSTMRRFQ